MLMFAGLGFFIWMLKQYKHEVIINQLVNNARRTIIRKARELYDRKTGIKSYKLLKEKDKSVRIIQYPPDYAISVGEKGNNVINVWRTESGQYNFIDEKINIREVPTDLFKIIPDNIIQEQNIERKESMIKAWKDDTLRRWMQSEGIQVALKVATSNQRMGLAKQIQKGNDRKRPTLWEFIPMGVSVITLVLMIVFVVVILSMGADYFKPAVDVEKEHTAQLQLTADISQTMVIISERLLLLEEGSQQMKSESKDKGG
jgi:hypothetical protein